MPNLLYYTGLGVPVYVPMPWSAEWGYTSKIDLALSWEKMTNGLWCSWDRGSAHDLYSCDMTWKGPSSVLASLRAVIHDARRGLPLLMQSEAGFYPWGPLVVTDEYVRIRIASMQPMSRIGGSSDWSMSLSMVLDPSPSPDLATRDTSDLWSKGRYQPVIDQGWALAPERVQVDPLLTSYESDVFLQTNRATAAKIIAGLTHLRGGTVSVPASRDPFGPGVPVSNGGGANHSAKVRSFSVSHDSRDVWSVSAAIARNP